jgi:hypothetical protein
MDLMKNHSEHDPVKSGKPDRQALVSADPYRWHRDRGSGHRCVRGFVGICFTEWHPCQSR